MDGITLICNGCGAEWHLNLDNVPVIVEPFPHIECPNCGVMVPVF